jgi:uncharacterized protein
MHSHKRTAVIELQFLDLDLSVCRLHPTSALPPWAEDSQFLSITRTSDELSLICETNCLPDEHDFPAETGWTAMRVVGTLDFALTGILASIAVPLADAAISVFAVSTFDTDYVLIRSTDQDQARRTLSRHFAVVKQ